MAVRGQPEHDPGATEHQHPAGELGTGADLAGVFQHIDDGGDRSDRVGDVVGAMGECHRRGREYLSVAEDALDVAEALAGARFRGQIDAIEHELAGYADRDCHHKRDADTRSGRQVESDMGQPLDQRDQTDDESGQGAVHGHVAARAFDRIPVSENQPPNRLEQQEGEQTGQQGRCYPAGHDLADFAPVDRLGAEGDQGKAQDGADDGLAGGYGQPAHRRHDQKTAGAQQCRQHAVDQQMGVVGENLRSDQSAADGLGDLATGQPCAQKLEYAGDDDRLADGDRARTHRRAHGIGDIVGTDAPSHEKTEDAGENQKQFGVLRDDRHARPCVGTRRRAPRAG